MKKIVRLMLFLMAFQMEVRVRAAGDLIEQPSACLKSKESCAIQVTGSAFHFEKDDNHLHATSGSALVRLAPDQWRLVKGAVWVEGGKSLQLESLYASTKATMGEYWVISQDSRILIRNMTASLKVTLRDGKTLEIPEGFEVWVSGMNSQGKTEYGMIEPVNMKEHLPMWNSLYRGSKEDFVKEVRLYRDNWGDLAQKSSQIYQTLTERKMASIEAQEKAEEARRLRKAAELQRMKEMYRQRVFER